MALPSEKRYAFICYALTSHDCSFSTATPLSSRCQPQKHVISGSLKDVEQLKSSEGCLSLEHRTESPRWRSLFFTFLQTSRTDCDYQVQIKPNTFDHKRPEAWWLWAIENGGDESQGHRNATKGNPFSTLLPSLYGAPRNNCNSIFYETHDMGEFF